MGSKRWQESFKNLTMEIMDPIPDSTDLVKNYLSWDIEQVFSYFHKRMQRVIRHKKLLPETELRRQYRRVFERLCFQSKTEMILLFVDLWNERTSGQCPDKNWTEAKIHGGLFGIWWEQFMDLDKYLFGTDAEFLKMRIYWNVRDLGKRLVKILHELARKFHFFGDQFSEMQIKLAARGTILSLPESEREVLLHGFSQ